MRPYSFKKSTAPHSNRPFVIVNKPKPLGNLTDVVEVLVQLSIIAIAIIMVIHAASNWSGFLTPLLAAIVFGLMLSPAVTALEKRSVPSVFAVAILMLTIGAAIFLAANLFWDAIQSGIGRRAA